MQYPERESNPRFRCERPASSTVRRSGHEERGCDGWGRTSVSRVTTGRPAVERRRIVHMDTPARFERAHVGPKPTALSPLSYGAMKRRQQDSNLRTALAACALATRCLAGLGHASRREEGEGVEPPRPCDPPVFETGYRAGGSPSTSDSGRDRTCASPGKSRELYRLSYGAMLMWLAGIEPATPRVSGGRSTS